MALDVAYLKRRFIRRKTRPEWGDWPRCTYCARPAICFGADLAFPRYRCPRCCHRDHWPVQHGSIDHLVGHEAAEGIAR